MTRNKATTTYASPRTRGTRTSSRCVYLPRSRSRARAHVTQANPEYLSVNWEASGGGAFAVIPLSEKGRVPEQIPLFRGHTAAVLDTDWYACARHIYLPNSAHRSTGVPSMIHSSPPRPTMARFVRHIHAVVGRSKLIKAGLHLESPRGLLSLHGR